MQCSGFVNVYLFKMNTRSRRTTVQPHCTLVQLALCSFAEARWYGGSNIFQAELMRASAARSTDQCELRQSSLAIGAEDDAWEVDVSSTELRWQGEKITSSSKNTQQRVDACPFSFRRGVELQEQCFSIQRCRLRYSRGKSWKPSNVRES